MREQKGRRGPRRCVRAVYLYTGTADVVKAETQDETSLAACRNLWRASQSAACTLRAASAPRLWVKPLRSIMTCRTTPCNAETRASIGLMFSKRCLKTSTAANMPSRWSARSTTPCSPACSLMASAFFYVNPLELVPGISGKAVTHRPPAAVASRMRSPNVARMVSSFGSYAYSENEDTFFIDPMQAAR